jgi:hypothetical protein
MLSTLKRFVVAVGVAVSTLAISWQAEAAPTLPPGLAPSPAAVVECEAVCHGTGHPFTQWSMECQNECEAGCNPYVSQSAGMRYAFCACTTADPAEPVCCTIVLMLPPIGDPYPNKKGSCNIEGCPTMPICWIGGGGGGWMAECVEEE